MLQAFPFCQRYLRFNGSSVCKSGETDLWIYKLSFLKLKSLCGKKNGGIRRNDSMVKTEVAGAYTRCEMKHYNLAIRRHLHD